MLRGGPGRDRLLGDAVQGGPGVDAARLGRDGLLGELGDDVLVGDAYGTVELPSAGGDRLVGGFGNDQHFCQLGPDVANGGPGFDGQDGLCEVAVLIP